jgi:hypothetical protein
MPEFGAGDAVITGDLVETPGAAWPASHLTAAALER